MNFRKAVLISFAATLAGIAGISYAQEDHSDSYYTTESAYSHGVKPAPGDHSSDDLNKREAERYQDMTHDVTETTTTVSKIGYQCPTPNSLRQ